MNAQHVTVCLTTISSRVRSLERTLTSLLEQEYPDFQVRVYWSDSPFLLDEGMPALPEDVRGLRRKHGARLRFCRVGNIGSYRKLLPFLAANCGEHQLVATADDDTIYPRDWLSRMVEAYTRYRCIVCYRAHYMVKSGEGFAPYRRWMTSGLRANPDILVLPTGKDGVLYHTSQFSPLVLDSHKALEVAPTADDLWFKWHTAVSGVEVLCLNPDYTSSFEVVAGGASLYDKYNRGKNNDETVAALVGYGTERLGFSFHDADPVRDYVRRGRAASVLS